MGVTPRKATPARGDIIPLFLILRFNSVGSEKWKVYEKILKVADEVKARFIIMGKNNMFNIRI
ncbi:MAG: hypothetical protein ACFCUM_15735 [Bacteroidales bacterium]